MKHRLFVSLVFMAFVIPCFGQTPATIRELHEGDTLPNIGKVNFLRSDMPDDFSAWCKDKLVILDFWATWCGPCVEELPLMDSLQQQFSDKLEVVPVAYETRAKVSSFVAGKLEIQGKGLSYLTDDTLLSKLFPHNVVPHIVWLLSGKVIAITGHEAVTVSHIQQAIDNANFKHYVKRDRDEYNLDSPLIFHNSDIIYRSVLSKYKYGWITGGVVFPFCYPTDTVEHRAKRIVMTNLTIAGLYIYAAYNFSVARQDTNAIIIESKERRRYCHPRLYPEFYPNMDDAAYLDWQVENCYCYEIIVPDSLDDKAFSNLMLADLNRLFKVKGALEKRWTDCYVLKKGKADLNKLRSTKANPNIVNAIPNDGLTASGFEDLTIEKILRFISQFTRGLPIVSEVKDKVPLDLYFKFTTDVTDINEVRSGFEKYGFKLVKTRRKLNLLVLKDK